MICPRLLEESSVLLILKLVLPKRLVRCETATSIGAGYVPCKFQTKEALRHPRLLISTKLSAFVATITCDILESSRVETIDFAETLMQEPKGSHERIFLV